MFEIENCKDYKKKTEGVIKEGMSRKLKMMVQNFWV